MHASLAACGHPQRGLKTIHVAGTNGKGSSSAMLERCLREAGYKTGFFSSPHLHRYVERVRIDGRPIAESEAAKRLSAFRKADLPLTFFEFTVLLAFEAFRDHGCDIVVLEVGLGGRLDATNVDHNAQVSLITRIAKDHTSILGDTLPAIAREKAGILREGTPAVLNIDSAPARRAAKSFANKRSVNAWVLSEDFHLEGEEAILPKGERVSVASLGLRGTIQKRNALGVVATLHRLRERGFDISDAAIAKGLKNASWPGRLEHQRAENGAEVIFDCAHNPDGAERFAEYIGTLPQKKRVLLFGALADKELEPMLAAFDSLVDHRVYAIPKIRRAPKTMRAFQKIRPGQVRKDIHAALTESLRLAGKDGEVLVCGSIFLVQAVRAALLGVRSDPPIAM